MPLNYNNAKISSKSIVFPREQELKLIILYMNATALQIKEMW